MKGPVIILMTAAICAILMAPGFAFGAWFAGYLLAQGYVDPIRFVMGLVVGSTTATLAVKPLIRFLNRRWP